VTPASDTPECMRGVFPADDGQDVMVPSSEAQKRVLSLVHQLAPEYGVSPRLALAVIRTESNFNPGGVIKQECAGADAVDS
jgi:soluble lytic murein transglycosylase-like protein